MEGNGGTAEYFEEMAKVSPETQEYLSMMNDEQLEAVVHEGSPLLILAGAGSGKTRVITTKIAYLIREKNVQPWQILAVTFTKKAANEMRERAIALDERAASVHIKTFHSFGAWFLRLNAEDAGISPSFTVYDDDDAVSLIQKAVPGLKKTSASHFAHLISLAKDYCILPDDDELSEIDADPEFRKVYKLYQSRLRETGNVDFGDLILLPYLVLKENEDIRRRMQRKFRVLMVDEYQDSNVAQFKLLQELSGISEGSGNYICVVGDDDQSIYKFRGAEVKNILTFAEHFPNTKTIRLVRNYRSKAEILTVADDVVRNNSGRLGKTLLAARGSGKKPVLAFLKNQDEEAEQCVMAIKKDVEKGANWSDWAILYRTNAQSLTFETAFMQNKIPYQVVGSLKFYEREEVKDILAYLALLANPRDEIAFRRIVNKPARGIGPKAQDAIVEDERSSPVLMDDGAGLVKSCAALAPTFPKKARDGAESFCAMMDSFREEIGEEGTFLLGKSDDEEPSLDFGGEERAEETGTGNLSDLIRAIIEKSGLKEHYEAEDEISGTQKVANMMELTNGAVPFDCTRAGLLEFLDHIELDRTDDDDAHDKNKVTLITLHNTKGLEFRKVIMTGMEFGIFPRTDKTGDDLEEERRLCYVGMTRAKDILFLTCCASRRLYGRLEYMEMSPFLREISPDDINITCSRGQETRKRLFLESAHGKNGLSNAHKSGDSLAAKWRKGTRLYCDECGYGEIIRCGETEAGEFKITVKFETGEIKSFLPKYSAHKLEIIRD